MPKVNNAERIVFESLSTNFKAHVQILSIGLKTISD